LEFGATSSSSDFGSSRKSKKRPLAWVSGGD